MEIFQLKLHTYQVIFLFGYVIVSRISMRLLVDSIEMALSLPPANGLISNAISKLSTRRRKEFSKIVKLPDNLIPFV